jgi:spermidine/putrescine transport system substrate-binding protein
MKQAFFLYALLLCLLLSMTACKRSERELHIFIWGDYIKPELVQKFEEEYDCKVIVDTFDSNEALYAKLKLGASGYDLIFPSNYIFEIMLEQGMLRKINPDAIPNLQNVDPAYTRFVEEGESGYGILYMVSSTGIAYRKDKVKDFIPSWTIFSRRDLKGRMTLLNDIREALGAALRHLGYSLNTTNDKEIEEAADLLIKWKKNLAKFESEQYKNGIASAEFLVVQGYSGDILQIMQENPHIEFVYPEEGIALSFDYLAIPASAPNPELAEQFINFLLDGANAAENMIFTLYLSPNTAAYSKLPPSLRTNPILFLDEEQVKNSELIKNVGAALSSYIKAWDRIKSSD